ncbi:hypothetical protein [Streptomyces sp. NPDC057280]|uniref:hypothetical protein n=1 Tax=Streptomyces sp. NPDC057280 TaxID=3346081 RepID=UPI003628BDE7
MSIPWQRHADEHARTVDAMTAALLFACVLPAGEIRLPLLPTATTVPSAPHAPSAPEPEERTP